MAYGLYECDDYAFTRSFYDEGYLDELLDLCAERNVDLLIPGHDDEAHLFARNKERIESAGVKVIAAGAELLALCRDKERMSNELNRDAPLFVRSFGKDAFFDAWARREVELPVIAKPRGGFASRGIKIILSEDDFREIGADYIVQEIAVPHEDDPQHLEYLDKLRKGINPQIAEISIQLVARQDGSLMGRMASYNKLSNGIPIEILPYDREEIWEEIDRILPKLVQCGLAGPFNLQGRFTEKGLKLFELNARFTGITGLRALMGFNEVEACLRHWLMNDDSCQLEINSSKAGIRQTADKVIVIERNEKVRNTVVTLNGGENKRKKTILLTGSTGVIGRQLLSKLLRTRTHRIWLLNRDKEKSLAEFGDNCDRHFDWQDFENGEISFGNIDCICHLAFARPNWGNLEVTRSLESTFSLFSSAVESGVNEIINVSSQSVYGDSTFPPLDEDCPVCPATFYGQAKYAVELFLKTACTDPSLKFTSMRLATVTGSDPRLLNYEAIYKLVYNAARFGKITIRGGDQLMDRIYVSDVTDALVKVIDSDSSKWRTVYNLGANNIRPIREVSNIIASVVNEAAKKSLVDVSFSESGNERSYGLNSDRFHQDFCWKPRYGYREMVVAILSSIERDMSGVSKQKIK